MNRRKTDHRRKISGIVFFSFILAGAIGAVGGISHVYFRNSQIQTVREIDAVEREIVKHELSIRTVDMRKDQLLNLFAMKKSLKDMGTVMRPIPSGMTEKVAPANQGALALAEPTL